MKKSLKNNKTTMLGFTLVEMLGILIILGVIAVIVFPTIKNLMNDAKKKSFINSAYGIIKAGNLYYSRKDMMGQINGNMIFTFPNNAEELKLQGKLPEQGNMIINEAGDIEIAISNKDYCITKGFFDTDITVTEDFDNCEAKILYSDSVLNGADPVLRTGMIPVVISADGSVVKADITKEWYDYTNKEWANAVLVDNDSRETYETMDAGEPIQETDILAYFVWIPRYKYKLWYVEAADGEGTATDASKIHSIDIVFENKGAVKSNGSQNGQYLTHPAFTFGEEELNGIWVGKFETGYNGDLTSGETNAIASSKVLIKPNTYPWSAISISNIFYTALGMKSNNNIFGLTENSDTHMMKNTEWGAATYLTFSKYGKNSEVYSNNYTGIEEGSDKAFFMTGCGADEADSERSSECLNRYGTKNDNIYNQSTTGNISGIFDMSSGSYEYVMGYSENSSTIYGDSGFTDETFPDNKYVDIYNSDSESDYSKRILGDATGEMGPFERNTGSWYSDFAHFVFPEQAWFSRGGSIGSGSGAGLASFVRFGGGGGVLVISFRVVLV